MKKTSALFVGILTVLFAGCNCIGNGTSKNYTFPVKSPHDIEIEGDWRVEVICSGNENSCEIIIDENLSDQFRVKNEKKLKVTLPSYIRPMVVPTVRIKLQKPFREFSLEGNSSCVIRNFNGNAWAEVEVSDRSVCTFEGGVIDRMNADVSENGKLVFKNRVKMLNVEVEDRGVLEVADVERLSLEASDNAVCRVIKCGNAAVEAEDFAAVDFKEVKSITEKVFGNGRITYPVVIPAELKK